VGSAGVQNQIAKVSIPSASAVSRLPQSIFEHLTKANNPAKYVVNKNILYYIAYSLIITSYVLWGCGFPLVLFVLVIYFHHITLIALPPREVIVSVFLPLGPLGQGTLSIMHLGKRALLLFSVTHTASLTPIVGQVLYVVDLKMGLII